MVGRRSGSSSRKRRRRDPGVRNRQRGNIDVRASLRPPPVRPSRRWMVGQAERPPLRGPMRRLCTRRTARTWLRVADGGGGPDEQRCAGTYGQGVPEGEGARDVVGEVGAVETTTGGSVMRVSDEDLAAIADIVYGNGRTEDEREAWEAIHAELLALRNVADTAAEYICALDASRRAAEKDRKLP